jgi:hypothetical protein
MRDGADELAGAILVVTLRHVVWLCFWRY